MPSILISFVGQQDPVSDKTREEGSIATLVHHLLATATPLKRLLLLYTTGANGTEDRALLTRDWLADAPFSLDTATIDLLPVDPGLSADPVDLWLAVQAAKKGLEAAIAHRHSNDTLEFNASSGTPVMKSAWSILQAAGYAPKSRLWQVRNPKEQQPGQARVFQTNIQVLRQTFDLKIIEQQLQDYNYNGALTTLKAAGLNTPLLEALLQYGYYRLSLDFAKARAVMVTTMGDRWHHDIVALCQNNPVMLLQEAYFNAVVELKNQQLANFIVRMAQFLEQALQFLVAQFLAERPPLPRSFEETKSFWTQLSTGHPDLWCHLQQSHFRGHPLRLEAFPSRPVLLAILEHANSPVLPALQALSRAYDQRNRYIHEFKGISELPEAQDLLNAMRTVLTALRITEFHNPFNALNQEILAAIQIRIDAPPANSSP